MQLLLPFPLFLIANPNPYASHSVDYFFNATHRSQILNSMFTSKCTHYFVHCDYNMCFCQERGFRLMAESNRAKVKREMPWRARKNRKLSEGCVRVVRGSTTQLYNRGGQVSASARALRQPNSATRVFRTSGRYWKCNPMSGNLITEERCYCRCSVRSVLEET